MSCWSRAQASGAPTRNAAPAAGRASEAGEEAIQVPQGMPDMDAAFRVGAPLALSFTHIFLAILLSGGKGPSKKFERCL